MSQSQPRKLAAILAADIVSYSALMGSDEPRTVRDLVSPPPKTGRWKGMIGAGSVGVSANRITLLRDADRDGVPETRSVLLQNLNQPFGMALVGGTLFVANTDGVMRFPYKEGQTRKDRPGSTRQAR